MKPKYGRSDFVLDFLLMVSGQSNISSEKGSLQLGKLC